MPSKNYRIPEQAQFVPVGFVIDTVFNGGSYSIASGYTDTAGAFNEKGKFVQYITHKDDKNRDVPKRFKFDQSIGRLLTRPSDTDINGKKQYAFLKNHPECEGSPNGIYETDNEGKKTQVGVTFRELDAAKDAKIALLIDTKRIEAEASALKLDDTTLAEIAYIIGYFGETDDFMRLKVVEFAKKKPDDYQNLIKAEDRGFKAILRKGVTEGVLRKQGPAIKWDQLVLGNSEDAAVAYLRDVSNKAVLEALQEKLELQITIVEPKNYKKEAASL